MSEPRRPLHPDTVLQRVPDVTLRLTGANTVDVQLETRRLDCGHAGLRVLERLARPASLREIAAEPVAGAQAWMDRMSAVLNLVRNGILRDVSDDTTVRASEGYHFDNPTPHVEMLDDHVRTERFIAAIEATVRPGDVVVDIGTGTGILAMAAARAGAAHVYAIEAGAIALKAEEVIAANGFADRITVLRGWSSSITLPRLAHVLVTETIGSDPLDEQILEIVGDARRRMLEPDARIVPSRLRIVATAVEVPDDWIDRHVYTESAVGRWRDRYGFDFGPLVTRGYRRGGLRVVSASAGRWKHLGPSVVLADLDLASTSATSVDAAMTATATTGGRLDGALLHFDTDLAPGISITSDPAVPNELASWRNVLTLRPPVTVQPGDVMRLAYRWRAPSGPNGLTVEFVGDA